MRILFHDLKGPPVPMGELCPPSATTPEAKSLQASASVPHPFLTKHQLGNNRVPGTSNGDEPPALEG